MKKVVAYYLQDNDNVRNAMERISNEIPHVKLKFDENSQDYGVLFVKCDEKYLAQVEDILAPYV